MAKKDFTQTAFSVVQQATGEAPKQAQKPMKKAVAPVTRSAAKKQAKKPV